MRGFFLLVALLLFTCQAYAAPSWQVSFDEGRNHFQSGQWQKAYDAFHQAFLLEPGNPEISFYLGRAAYEKGDYENAVMAFDRVLIIDPDSHRVKLELARSYMGLKAWSVARRYFNEVLDSSPPPEVVNNIQIMLGVISEAQRRHFFSGMFSLEYSLADNVHTSPVSNTVSTVLGDVALTGTGSSPVSDKIFNTTFALNHRYKGDVPFAWQSTGVFVNSAYDTEDTLDVNYLGISTGPMGQQGRFSWELKGLASFLELDDHSYLRSSGAEAGASLGLSSRIRIDSSVRVENKEFRTVEGRDAVTTRITIAPVIVFGSNRITLTMGGEVENAEREVYSYDRLLASLRYEKKLPGDFLLSLSQEYRRSDYQQEEVLFGYTRLDEFWETTVGLSKVFWRSREKRRNLTGRLNYIYQNSNSTIPLYTYEKNVFTVSLVFGF